LSNRNQPQRPSDRHAAVAADDPVGIRAKPADPHFVPSAEPSTAAPNARATARRRLVAAGALAALWVVAIVILALLTANPVTLNREQILQSDLVVIGRFDPQKPSRLIVDESWNRESELAEIDVENHAATRARAGKSYVVPLTKTSAGRFKVTESLLPNSAPLIYPAGDEALEQLRALLPPQRPRIDPPETP